MQQRLACANLYMLWSSKHGRAMEALACSLKQRHFAAESVFPQMDWDHCTLSCGGKETLPFGLEYNLSDVNIGDLENVDLRMKYLSGFGRDSK